MKLLSCPTRLCQGLCISEKALGRSLKLFAVAAEQLIGDCMKSCGNLIRVADCRGGCLRTLVQGAKSQHSITIEQLVLFDWGS